MIRREIAVFLVVGSLTVLVDFLTYRGLVWLAWAGIDLAKGTGFLVGTVFAYFANRFWTFGHTRHSDGTVFRFAGLYVTTLAANVLVNSFVLAFLQETLGAIQLAFLVATGVSACLNFIGMKLFVFADISQKEDA